jgi:fumarylacetoacetate (FAA) hydrolase
MKLVCYIKDGQEQLAMLSAGNLYDMDALHPELPSSMSMFLNYWDDYFPLAKAIHKSIQDGRSSLSLGLPVDSIALISPVPLPASCRRALAFGNSTGDLNTATDEGLQPTPFHFFNHHTVQGPGEVSCMPDFLPQLQFEAGVAVVISSQCRNITAAGAEQHIAGYMLMTRIAADGPFQGIDVCSVSGPWLVTGDEMEACKEPGENEMGMRYNLTLDSNVNGERNYRVNFAGMNRSFAEIVASCAYGAGLQPGDIIFCPCPPLTGLPGTGNSGSALKVGDTVTLEMEEMGTLTTTILAEETGLLR